MHPNDEVITVNKQALIQAVVELERQEYYRNTLLWEHLTTLESITHNLHNFLIQNPTAQTRGNLLALFQPNPEWSKIISEELIDQWEADFQQECLNSLNSDTHQSTGSFIRPSNNLKKVNFRKSVPESKSIETP